jgi:Chaperonin 10 Kd subunit
MNSKTFYGEKSGIALMSKHTLRPLRDLVVIEYEDPDEMTKGGIVIPQKHREKSLYARVLAVGPGKWMEINRKAFAYAHTGPLTKQAQLMKGGIDKICDMYGIVHNWLCVPCVLKPGDRVAVGHANFPYKFADGTVYVVQEDWILGKVD